MINRPKIAIPVPTTNDLEYNLRSWRQYAIAVERGGGDAVEIRLGQGRAATLRLLQDCSGVLLPGSGADVEPSKYGHDRAPESAPADPAREEVDELLLDHAEREGKPVLAICFGMQMLNVWRGGTLLQDVICVPVNHKAGRSVAIAHSVAIAPESLLGTLVAGEEAPERDGFLRLPVNSSHHQAVGIPGEGLRVSARSSEDGVIEAIEEPVDGEQSRFVVGVQWHPERTIDNSAASGELFARFVREAAVWAAQQAVVPVG